MKFTTVKVCFILLMTPIISYADIQLTPGILYFNYQELDDAGSNLNHETGFLPGITATINYTSHSLSFGFFTGTVDYDGYTQSLQPLQTSTTETLYNPSYRYTLNQPVEGQLQYYIGSGFRSWKREIHPTYNVYGLDEIYNWWQIDAGINKVLMQDSTTKLSLDFGILYTLLGTMTVDLQNYGFGSPELKLGNKPGVHGNLQWRISHHNSAEAIFGIDFKYFEFGKSNRQTISNGIQTITIEEPHSVSKQTLFYFGIIQPF